MAHIPDGVLSAPVLVLGGALTAVGLTIALRRLDDESLPQAAVLAAAFFIVSLISLPIGASSVHLLLNGLIGLLLGWTAVPVLLISLGLQAVFFGHGGLLSLGVNTLNLALPALLCGFFFRPLLRPKSGCAPSPRRAFWVGGLSGTAAAAMTGACVALSLALSGQAFWLAAKAVMLAFVPVALLEGAVTATVVGFLARVEPRLLGVRLDDLPRQPLAGSL